MQGDFTKSERKRIRQLASLAWERELRGALGDIAAAIAEMENGTMPPFEVDNRIHKFHDGTSRDLYKQYSDSNPWIGVCRAYFEGILTNDDIADASDEIRHGIREFSASFAKLRERDAFPASAAAKDSAARANDENA